MEDHVGHIKALRHYHKSDGKPLKCFKERNSMIRSLKIIKFLNRVLCGESIRRKQK